MYKPALLFCLILAVESTYSQSVVIQTTNGQIRGAEKTTRLGRKHYAFLGIPYAKPPVGDLRFEVQHTIITAVHFGLV